MLPLPGAITSQLDKASIVRLTIAYLRLREFAAHGDPPWNRDGRFDGKPTLKGNFKFFIKYILMKMKNQSFAKPSIGLCTFLLAAFY